MEFHWGDCLDRETGLFTMVENRFRGRYAAPDLAAVRADVPILTVTKATLNWQRMVAFTALEELTLHEPLPGQIAALAEMPRLRRLRITHARPADLEPLRGLGALEELVLEYVSKVADLSPLGALPGLRALHLENLRGLRDLSGLAGAGLRTLQVTGTLDWAQPIDGLDVLPDLPRLERLHLGTIRLAAGFPAFRGIAASTAGFVSMPGNLAPLRDYAWLAARRPDLAPCLPPVVDVVQADPHVLARIRADLAQRLGGEIDAGLAAKLQAPEPGNCELVTFLGKGERSVDYRFRPTPHLGGPDPATLQRMERHEARFAELLAAYKDARDVTDS